ACGARALPGPPRAATRRARAPTRSRGTLDSRRSGWRVALGRAPPNGSERAHAVRRVQLFGPRVPRTRAGTAAWSAVAAPVLHPQRALRRTERHAPPNEAEGRRLARPRAPRERRALPPRGPLTCASGPASRIRSAQAGTAKAS